MSDLKIVLAHADAREDRTVTTGTKAWELFADDTDGDRGPRQRRAQGPRVRARRRRRGRGRGDRQQGRPRHPAALDRARDGAGRAAALPGRQARHRAADRERLLLRLRRRDPVRARGPREDRDRDAEDHQGGPALRAPGHHRPRRDRRAQGRAVQDRADRAQGLRASPTTPAEGASVEVGAGELTIYDNVRPQRRGRLERPVPRPAPADHQADPGVQADALARRRTGAATRRTSSSSASTAPPGSPRRRSRSTCTGSRRPSAATTASSAATSTSSASPTRSAPACAVFHPKGGVIKREMEDYVRQRHIEEGFQYVGTPHITKEGLFHTSGHLPYYARHHVPADGVRGRELLPQGR